MVDLIFKLLIFVGVIVGLIYGLIIENEIITGILAIIGLISLGEIIWKAMEKDRIEKRKNIS